ncbi:minor capsid protein [Levilactobacillus enshiensis]|uniref:minor capsid protein n=1 Tax=Levilactobacillus enshiensis TaxID=2590213 RepID=UPI001CDC58D7|nr:minor capsid protein [Levilactobacillus enshiensis]
MADKDKLNYWERRAVWLEQQQHDKGDKHIDALIQAYLQAQKYLVNESKQIYTRYLDKSDLTEAEVARILNTQVTPDQLVVLHQMIKSVEDKAVKKQLQTYLDGLAVKHRITQAELLRAKSYVVAKQLADVQLKESEPYYIDVMQDAYNRATAESIIGQTQKDFNVYQGDVVPDIDRKREQIQFVNPKSGDVIHKVDVSADKPITHLKELSTDYVKQSLDEPWEGCNYSQRIWDNTDGLAKRLQTLFAAKQMSGMSERDMAQALMKEFSVGAYQARRLIRTESAYISNQARLHAWKGHHVEEYSLLAVLDFRTSNICRHMDGKVFKVKDAKVAGKEGNYPPFHPFCRTIAVAHFTKSKHGGYRTARDPIVDKAIKIPADATYRDWEKMLLNKHGKQDVQLMQKKIANQSSDIEQYRRYQSVLGNKNVAKTFDDFQTMKYTDGGTYQQLVNDVREVKLEQQALANLHVKSTEHRVPYEQEPNSVYDRFIEDQLISRRYYGRTGKARLDIDFTNHGNNKIHTIVPHAHTWLSTTTKDGKMIPRRERPGRKLSKAERIVNDDQQKHES